MRVDLLILQLALIFLPGIIWARLDASFAAKVKPSEAEFFLRAFLFGLATYAIEYLIFAALGRPFETVNLAEGATHGIISAAVLNEILLAIGMSLGLSLFWLYATRFKLITRALQTIGATRKFGDEDVWDLTFNSRDIAVEYIHFRDFDTKCVYAGWVDTFSETDKVRELILIDVIVYDIDGVELYRTPRLYLARSRERIHIEFPYAADPSGGTTP